MIKIHCHTNLDLVYERWPTELPELPRVGDCIQSMTEWENGFRLILKVVSVVWKYNGEEYKPHVELHIGSSMSLYDFYKWYAPLVGSHVSAFI